MRTETTRFLGIVACITSTTIVTITLGLTWPFLSLVLERQGVSEWMIGLSASVQMLAVLLMAPFAPRIIGALGTAKTLVMGLIGMAGSLALLPVFPNVWAWFPIRLCLGFFAELLFTVGDIWINQLAREATRARLIAVFSLFSSAGLALGPLAIKIFGAESWDALWLGVGIILFGLIPVYFARSAVPVVEGKPRARLLHFMRHAPTIIFAGLMFGLIESATFALYPIYGVSVGLTKETAALLLTMFVVGSVSGQLPLGWLADKVDCRKLMAVCVFLCMIAVGSLPYAFDNIVTTWLAMGVIGLSQGSFYLLGMTMIGSRYKGADLVGVNACFVFVWGLGMVAGPAIAGTSMDLLGPHGLPFATFIFCAVFLWVIVRRIRQNPAENAPG